MLLNPSDIAKEYKRLKWVLEQTSPDNPLYQKVSAAIYALNWTQTPMVYKMPSYHFLRELNGLPPEPEITTNL